MKDKAIIIYTHDRLETYVKEVNTIQEAAHYIGTSTNTLYRHFHLDGVMHDKGFKIELVNMKEEV